MGRTKIAGFHRKSYKTLQVMARKNASFHRKINGMGVVQGELMTVLRNVDTYQNVGIGSIINLGHNWYPPLWCGSQNHHRDLNPVIACCVILEAAQAAITFNGALFPTCYGPEYISETLRKWAEKHTVSIQHIQPGQLQQNVYVERYNRTVRPEWLDQYIIESIEEAVDQATQWLWTYNNDRPNMGIGGITPAMKPKMAA
jgi:hypothetical protein